MRYLWDNEEGEGEHGVVSVEGELPSHTVICGCCQVLAGGTDCCENPASRRNVLASTNTTDRGGKGRKIATEMAKARKPFENFSSSCGGIKKKKRQWSEEERGEACLLACSSRQVPFREREIWSSRRERGLTSVADAIREPAWPMPLGGARPSVY